jgi:hypothetical protein
MLSDEEAVLPATPGDHLLPRRRAADGAARLRERSSLGAGLMPSQMLFSERSSSQARRQNFITIPGGGKEHT